MLMATPAPGRCCTDILRSFSTLKLSALITWPSLDQVTTEPSAEHSYNRAECWQHFSRNCLVTTAADLALFDNVIIV